MPGEGPDGRKTVKRAFKTFYGVLRECARWLTGLGVTHVAMEATGSTRCRCIRALLAHGEFEVLMCNDGRVKNVPGRKTDRLTELSASSHGGACLEGFGWLGSQLVSSDADVPRELSGLVVPRRGSLVATGELFEPFSAG